jgi:hypothetical protein
MVSSEGGIVSSLAFLVSFRGDAKHRTRNLEIPGLVLAHHPGMTSIRGRGLRQLTRFQVWPPQNIPPKAQPCTRIAFGPFMTTVES